MKTKSWRHPLFTLTATAALIICSVILIHSKSDSASSEELNLYLDFRLPINIRDFRTVPDAVLYGAIASPLISFDSSGQISGSLAESWTVDMNSNKVKIKLRSARWSDGSEITSKDIASSFQQASTFLTRSASSLVENISDISIVAEDVIEFTLRAGFSPRQFLEQQSEVIYGISKTKDDTTDTSVSSGPYVIKQLNANQIVLEINPYWHGADSTKGIFPLVNLRKPKQVNVFEDILNDPWPSLIQVPNFIQRKHLPLISSSRLVYSDLNGLFNLSYGGKLHLDKFLALSKFLRSYATFKNATDLVADAAPAHQIFPEGATLYSESIPPKDKVSRAELNWVNNRGISVAFVPTRFPIEVAIEICKSIQLALNERCDLVETEIQSLQQLRKEGRTDFILSGLLVDTFNIDGALSYYLEPDYAVIPSGDTVETNFQKKLKSIRRAKSGNRTNAYKKLVSDIVQNGAILPIFHASSGIITRRNAALSKEYGSTNGFSIIDVRRGP